MTAGKPPIYSRVLGLRYIRPSGWQRAVFIEGAFALGIVLTLADVATAWTILVLPAIVAVIVKAHDVVAAEIARRPTRGWPRA